MGIVAGYLEYGKCISGGLEQRGYEVGSGAQSMRQWVVRGRMARKPFKLLPLSIFYFAIRDMGTCAEGCRSIDHTITSTSGFPCKEES